MSRQYMLERWCVRCNRLEPTPYLAKWYPKLIALLNTPMAIVDIGCGNGRNCKWLSAQCKQHSVAGFDMAGDFGTAVMLGNASLPYPSGKATLILLNYSLMFLNKKERTVVYTDIDRVAKPDHVAMIVELYPAKDSETKTDADCEKLLKEIIKAMDGRGWEVHHKVKNRCILTKGVSHVTAKSKRPNR